MATHQACPVCGASMHVTALRGHIGTERCRDRLTSLGGVCVDAVRGPRILTLAVVLDAAIRAPVASETDE